MDIQLFWNQFEPTPVLSFHRLSFICSYSTLIHSFFSYHFIPLCVICLYLSSIILPSLLVRTQGIWDCPDQDQEVGAKHINETKMFQMTSRETMEIMDEEAGDLVDLEDESEFEQTHEST